MKKKTDGLNKSEFLRGKFRDALEMGAEEIIERSTPDEDFHICMQMDDELKEDMDNLSRECSMPVAKIMRLMIMGN